MKTGKKILTYVLTAAFAFQILSGGMPAGESLAKSQKQEYTYTVTFSAGKQGTFNDSSKNEVKVQREGTSQTLPITVSGDKMTVKEVKSGDVLSFTAQTPGVVQLASDSKYYVKGVRASGRDNEEAVTTIFTVNSDMDYVVAYGVKGEQVKYTVNYQDKNGKTLAPSESFYGNVGDKPVVAYKYIEGYAPQAFGLTKTLSSNEAENVFTFVYEPVPGPTTKVETEIVNKTETIEQVIPGGTVGGGTSASGTGGAGNNTASANGTEENGGEANGEAENPSAAEGEGALIVDLDPEIPLANIDADSKETSDLLPMIAYAGIGLLALLAVILAVWIYQKLKKKEEA